LSPGGCGTPLSGLEVRPVYSRISLPPFPLSRSASNERIDFSFRPYESSTLPFLLFSPPLLKVRPPKFSSFVGNSPLSPELLLALLPPRTFLFFSSALRWIPPRRLASPPLLGAPPLVPFLRSLLSDSLPGPAYLRCCLGYGFYVQASVSSSLVFPAELFPLFSVSVTRRCGVSSLSRGMAFFGRSSLCRFASYAF